MTREIYDGPGTETYRSSLFTASIGDGGEDVYVYKVAHPMAFTCRAAALGATLTLSWITYGSDQTEEVTITRVAGAITSAIIYPKHLDIDYSVDGNAITMTVPSGARLMVELNGEQNKPIMVFAKGLKADLSDGNPVDTFTNEGAFPSATGGRTLYFGPGLHSISQLYEVPTGARVYLDGGAWVIGSFDVRSSDNFTIEGPGVLSGEYEDGAAFNRNQPFLTMLNWAVLLGYDGADYSYSNNQFRDVTCVDYVFYGIMDGANHVQNVNMLSPWWPNTDGVGVRPDLSLPGDGDGNPSTIQDCFFYCGDDTIKATEDQGDKLIDGNVIVNSASSALLFSYLSDTQSPGKTVVTSNTIVSKAFDYYPAGGAGPNAASNIKLWLDGSVATPGARTEIEIDTLWVEGPGVTPLFTIENLQYPWGNPRDAYGQAYDITFTDVDVETNPGERSRLHGLDATNTPHDMTFANITIGGTLVHEGNWDTYVDQNAFPYNITLDVEPDTTTFVVEDGSGLSTANSYMTLAEADDRAIARGNPTVWSAASDAQKRAWLRQGAEGIDLTFGGRWQGYRRTEDQLLDWPRIGVCDKRSGRAVLESSIPIGIKRTQFEFALSLASDIDPLANIDATDASVRSRWATSTTDRIPGGFDESRTYANGAPVTAVLVRMNTFAEPFLSSGDDTVGLA